MGGLAIRAWLRAFAADDRVARVITIGTPHGGTWIAHQGRGANARQMRLGSDWLRALAAAEPASRARLFTCWWSECDQIVGPAPTAVLPGSEERRLQGRAHVEMAGDETIWRDLVQRLGVQDAPRA
jgi:triacylglycerol esterase/lipase EstA (alpha/beta hydrolase family)